jgi:hypothetical protein
MVIRITADPKRQAAGPALRDPPEFCLEILHLKSYIEASSAIEAEAARDNRGEACSN